jgi:hypothetical protein
VNAKPPAGSVKHALGSFSYRSPLRLGKDDGVENAVPLLYEQRSHALSELGELRICHERRTTLFAVSHTLEAPQKNELIQLPHFRLEATHHFAEMSLLRFTSKGLVLRDVLRDTTGY